MSPELGARRLVTRKQAAPDEIRKLLSIPGIAAAAQQREAEDKAKIEWLRAAVQEGVDAMERGDYIVLNGSGH